VINEGFLTATSHQRVAAGRNVRNAFRTVSRVDDRKSLGWLSMKHARAYQNRGDSSAGRRSCCQEWQVLGVAHRGEAAGITLSTWLWKEVVTGVHRWRNCYTTLDPVPPEVSKILVQNVYRAKVARVVSNARSRQENHRRSRRLRDAESHRPFPHD